MGAKVTLAALKSCTGLRKGAREAVWFAIDCDMTSMRRDNAHRTPRSVMMQFARMAPRSQDAQPNRAQA